MIVEIYTFSIFIIAGIVNIFILLGITVFLLKIFQTIQEIYHNFTFDRMIKRTDEDIERLVKKRVIRRPGSVSIIRRRRRKVSK